MPSRPAATADKGPARQAKTPALTHRECQVRPRASVFGRTRQAKTQTPKTQLLLPGVESERASLSDGSVRDAVADPRPDRAHGIALRAVADGRSWLAGRPPDRRAACPAYLAYAPGRSGGRLETTITGGRTGDENTSKKYSKKHG